MRKFFTSMLALLFAVMVLSSPVFAAGSSNDLAYFGYNELGTTAAVGVTDEVVVFESDIPKQGGTVQDIVDLAVGGTATTTYTVQVGVTLTELNAGKIIIAAVSGKQIIVTDFNAVMNGSFAALTSAELEDSSATINVCSFAQAQMADNAILTKDTTGTTLGVGCGEGITSGEGLVITVTGSDATTATGLTVTVTYMLV